MIALEAKIEGYDGVQDVDLTIQSWMIANISANPSALLNKRLPTRKPFIIGSSVLGDGSTFSNGEQYFIGSTLSKANGDFFEVFEGPNLETLITGYYSISFSRPFSGKITIFFDVENDNHPNKINLVVYSESAGNTVSQEVEVSSAVFSYDLENMSLHGISILDWNKANAPLVITGIYLDLEVDINSQNMSSLSAPIAERGDLSLPSWGIISNKGQTTFTDSTGIVEQYDEMGWLKDGNRVNISLVNTQFGKRSEVASMFASNWRYDADNKQVSLDFTDGFEEWHEINVPSIIFNPAKIDNMAGIYEYLRSYTPSKFGMPIFEDLDIEVRLQISNTPLPTYQLQGATLWQQWNKFCVACQLHLFAGKDGKPKFTYNEGN